MIFIVVARLLLEKKRGHDAKQEKCSCFALAHERPELFRIKAVHDRNGPTAAQHHKNNAHAPNMENRHVDQEAIFTSDKVPGFGARVRKDVQIGGQHSL